MPARLSAAEVARYRASTLGAAALVGHVPRLALGGRDRYGLAAAAAQVRASRTGFGGVGGQLVLSSLVGMEGSATPPSREDVAFLARHAPRLALGGRYRYGLAAAAAQVRAHGLFCVPCAAEACRRSFAVRSRFIMAATDNVARLRQASGGQTVEPGHQS